MNLLELRNYIRTQLDMDEEELPNALLDSYLVEGYQRTIALEPRWPSFEYSWEITKPAADLSITLPPNCEPAGLWSVIDTGRRLRLVQVSNEEAEDNLYSLQTVAQPVYYTLWGSELRLWPNPSADTALALRGYRYPNDWVAGGAGAEPDCDQRLHILLAHYAIALCYAQQEDEVLEDVYMKRWQSGFAAARAAICQPRHHRPLILNGGLPFGGAGGNPVVWGPPVGP